MNKDDIIRMAQEAGFGNYAYEARTMFERFFNMAQAHALANVDPSKFMSYQEGVEAGRFAEREACAKLCLETEPFYGVMFAEAIRAREQA